MTLDAEQPEYLGRCIWCDAPMYRLPSGKLVVKDPDEGCPCTVSTTYSNEEEELIEEYCD